MSGTIKLSPMAAGSPLAAVAPNINISRSSGYEGEGTIAVDPTNPLRLFSASKTAGNGLFGAYSTDGGSTWTQRALATGADLPLGDRNAHAAFDTFGNLYLTYLSTSPQRAVQIAVSANGGQTFTLLKTITGIGVDQPSVATGGDTASAANRSVWVTYANGTGGISAVGARVTEVGATGVSAFSAAQAVPGATGNFGDVAVAPGGQVVVTWQTNTTNEGPGNINVSTDGNGLAAGGFAAPVTVTATNVGGFDFLPAQPDRSVDAEANLAYDLGGGASGGRLYLAYTNESPDESNNTDVFVRTSTNHGATWGAPVRVNDDAGTRTQMLPEIAVDRTTGNVAVGWYDARNDAGVVGPGSLDAVANNDAQFWGAVSTDGGLSFLTNFQISGGASSAAASSDANDYGDYTGLDFHGGSFFPVWADNSAALPGNPARPQFDLATAKVTVSSLAGPRVDRSSPSGVVFGPASSVDFTFDRPMNPASFAVADDVISFTGPGGVDLRSQVTGFSWLNNNTTLRLTFNARTALGDYSVVIGPQITAASNGAAMDQDADGVAGSAANDRYTNAFSITPPRVVSHDPAGTKVGTRTFFDFTFNQAMDPASFTTAADVVSFTGPGNVNLLPRVTGSAWRDGNTTLRVTFETQGADGLYTMAIGPQVRAAVASGVTAGGALMDQDGDNAAGEATDDRYVATVTINRSTAEDAFGYRATTNAPDLTDLTGSANGATSLLDDVDDLARAVPLGTNSFSFYGTNYTGNAALYVSTNGLITFGVAPGADHLNTDLTTAPAAPAIAPLWDDWRSEVGSDSRVLYRFDDLDKNGTSDRLVVEWNNMVNRQGAETDPGTFQAILQLNTGAGAPGEILFNYPDVVVGSASGTNGAGATVGIKGAGTQGPGGRWLLVSMNDGAGPWVGSGRAIRIATTPQGPQAPVVNSLVGPPPLGGTGTAITLTANGVVDIDGSIASVAFYRESNNQPGLQTGTGGDAAVGTDSSGVGGYTAATSTAGLADGTYTYYARATDNAGLVSNVAASASMRIDNTPPTVSIIPVTPNPRSGPMGPVTIVFSEPVTGFDLADMTLTRDGGPNLLAGQTLTTTDNKTFSLGLSLTGRPAGDYVLTVNPTNSGVADTAGNLLASGATNAWRNDAVVAGRRVFYNGSLFDGSNPAANASDDSAIAPDKAALLPGQAATFANYTSYSKGINGVMVDVFGLVATPTAADFTFKVGNDGSPDAWADAPAPTLITRRDNNGTGGSDRLSVLWADGAIRNTWLQVTVLANARTGLPAPDVFYFGNAPGESGDSPTDAIVDIYDRTGVRANPRTIDNLAPITFAWDYNRDRLVDYRDEVIARNNEAGYAPTLALITVPATPAPPARLAPATTSSPAAPAVTTTTTTDPTPAPGGTAKPASFGQKPIKNEFGKPKRATSDLSDAVSLLK